MEHSWLASDRSGLGREDSASGGSRLDHDGGPRDWGDLTYYRVEGAGLAPGPARGAWVGVDRQRAAAEGDLLLVLDEEAGRLVGTVEGLGRDPVLHPPLGPALRLDAHAVIGVVALVLAQT